MNSTFIFPGIVQHRISTGRLTIAYLEAGMGALPIVLLHGSCVSSLLFQDFMLALAATGRYRIYAPDMRGFGDTESLSADATRGVRDYSDDLAAFVGALDLPPFHLFAWSLGGIVAMQYMLDYPGMLRSLTLQATASPFGFLGTKDVDGTPTWPDYAGSGAGVVNTAFVQHLAQRDRGNDPASPRTVLNTLYFKPSYHIPADREEIYVSSMFSMRIALDNYPGDLVDSPYWPRVAPGTFGPNNAFSPKYLNLSHLATCDEKPPVLWIHGEDDRIVFDTSLCDPGFLGQLGKIPGWPGTELFPPQPMKAQIRAVLKRYRANGGVYREVVLPDCGHTPHIEKQADVVALLSAFVDAHV